MMPPNLSRTGLYRLWWTDADGRQAGWRDNLSPDGFNKATEWLQKYQVYPEFRMVHIRPQEDGVPKEIN